jgi:uncharacterized alkaline shock family protein YloU
MEGGAVISHDVLASYAADAALGIPGVGGVIEGTRRHRGVRVTEKDGAFELEIHVAVAWGAGAPEIGAVVQERVSEYLAGVAKLPALSVDVVVAGIAVDGT